MAFRGGRWLLPAAVACHGGDGTSGEPDGGGLVLSTTATAVDAEGEIVEDTCGGDVRDLFDELTNTELKFDQVSTGLSVFFDPDIGWIPCTGSVSAFVCQWGNAPPDTPAGVWTWTLEGTLDDGALDATLTLEVTCADATAACEACTILEDVQGR